MCSMVDARPTVTEPDGQPLTGFTVRCQVSLPGMRGAKVTEQVRAALVNMDGLGVHYSESLDLVVVSPSG
jgi:hypothetical protein